MMNRNDNRTLHLIRKKEWMLLVAIILVCCGAALWIFLGTIQTTATVEGCVFSNEGRWYAASFVDSSYAEKIRLEKTDSKIYIDGYDEDKYGYVKGRAAFVSNSPVDKEKANETFGSEDAVRHLTGGNSRTYLTVFDMGDTDSPIEFSKGKTVEKAGQFVYCDVEIILDENHPYQLIF